MLGSPSLTKPPAQVCAESRQHFPDPEPLAAAPSAATPVACSSLRVCRWSLLSQFCGLGLWSGSLGVSCAWHCWCAF